MSEQQPPSEMDQQDLVALRREKLRALRKSGRAYPNTFQPDATAMELHGTYEDLEKAALDERHIKVRVAGRMMTRRVMGKASFAHIRDASGDIQLFLQRDRLGESEYQAFKAWDLGDVIGAEGTLFKTRTGELSVRVYAMRMLSKSLRPLPEKFHGLKDPEIRYRQRYVDLIMNPDVRQIFRRRAEILHFCRSYLDAQGFMEVETPMMQPMAGGAVARPFVTHHNALNMPLYLRVAPELYLKRLIVGGLGRVYELNRNFRNEGVSTRHNPEFTMLEAYQAYGDCRSMMVLTEALVRGIALDVVGLATVEYGNWKLDFATPFRIVTVEDAVCKAMPELERDRLRDLSYLGNVLESEGIDVASGAGWGRCLVDLFEAKVEGTLIQPTFVTAYPLEVSPLARRNDDDPELVDRFELFIAGREIANGFSELNDPDDQAERFEAQARARAGGDDEAMVYDRDYIRALEYGMPPTGGVGIGIDRVTMLFTNANSIREVLLFPLMRPEGGGSKP